MSPRRRTEAARSRPVNSDHPPSAARARLRPPDDSGSSDAVDHQNHLGTAGRRQEARAEIKRRIKDSQSRAEVIFVNDITTERVSYSRLPQSPVPRPRRVSVSPRCTFLSTVFISCEPRRAASCAVSHCFGGVVGGGAELEAILKVCVQPAEDVTLGYV